MTKKDEKLLYKSLDTALSPAEQKRLDSALQTDPELGDERELLLGMRRQIAAAAYGPFQAAFNRQVMSRILGLSELQQTDAELFYGSLMGAFRRLAWAGGLAVAVMIAIQLLGSDALALENSWLLPDLSIEELLELSVF